MEMWLLPQRLLALFIRLAPEESDRDDQRDQLVVALTDDIEKMGFFRVCPTTRSSGLIRLTPVLPQSERQEWTSLTHYPLVPKGSRSRNKTAPWGPWSPKGHRVPTQRDFRPASPPAG